MLGAVLGTLWMVGLVVPPFLLSRAVDALTGAEPSTVLVWSAALVATGTIGGRDAVHAATALAAGFTEIVSADRDLDRVPGLTRRAPDDLPAA